MLPGECSKESPGKERTKVTLVIWRAAPGGIEKSLFNYLDNLGEVIDFTIYSLRPVDKEKHLFSGCRVNLRCGHRLNIILYWKFLVYSLKNRRHIFHLFDAGPFTLTILRLVRVKRIIYHIHGTVFWRTKVQEYLRKFLLLASLGGSVKKKVHILSNSEFSKSEFNNRVSSNVNVEVLYNPLDIKEFSPVEKTRSSQLRILYVGRLVKGKNLLLWIDAAEHILKYFPQARFKIVGSGVLKDRLSERIEEKGLGSYIELTGYIKNVESVYRESDLLLFISAHESFGNVVVESILTQTPVIASAIPAMKEIFRDYPEFLVELNERIFFSIVDRLRDFDSLKAAAKRARKDFVKKFNIGNHIARVKELYLGKN